MSWSDSSSNLWQWGVAAAASSGILFCVVMLVGPILRPNIISYPWPEPPKRTAANENTTVVLAGSFNPPHNGHLAMLLYLVERYGDVIVVVGMNPNKKYLVSPEERAALIRRMLDPHAAAKHVRVEVVSGYIWRTVKPMGAQLFARGIRSWEKDGAEERNLQILNTWGPLVLGPLWWPLPTVFLEGHPKYNHVSSTLIRNLCAGTAGADKTLAAEKEELKDLVPDSILEAVARLYGASK